MSRRTIGKLMLAAAAIFLAGLVNQQYVKGISPQSIREWILSFGSLSPLVLLGFGAVRPFIFIPYSLVTLASGLAFGAVWGTILSLSAAAAGGTAAFLAAEKAGRTFFLSRMEESSSEAKELLEKNGFTFILILRLIPVINFDLLSIVAGMSSVRLRPFVLATVVGSIPGTLALNVFGNSFVSGEWEASLALGAVMLLIMLVPAALKRKDLIKFARSLKKKPRG
ncbi:TVP38/TMEM64 family protein [Bacillus marinisedimentorum]|uniref:TVP38/TMEM64 family protein n=1 Tax=Bacillus marinisedimentorum TaxID=1821260 RepID=UPI000872BC81|nr:TVP38/TMEM64 family protein [Bacillus marinisedimentorum]